MCLSFVKKVPLFLPILLYIFLPILGTKMNNISILDCFLAPFLSFFSTLLLSINQSIFNLNSHKHFYSAEKKNRIHLNIVYNLHIEDDK